MRRIRGGDYETLDGRYRVIREWADATPRRTWTVIRVSDHGDHDLLSDHRTLAAARTEVERLEKVDG